MSPYPTSLNDKLSEPNAFFAKKIRIFSLKGIGQAYGAPLTAAII